MAATTSRTLELLSLLQSHRHWTARELVSRLDVSERTLRRDVEAGDEFAGGPVPVALQQREQFEGPGGGCGHT